MISKTTKLLFSALFTVIAVSACQEKPGTEKEAAVKPADEQKTAALPDIVKVNSPALYPEGVEWDQANQRFLVGSLRKGTLGSVKDDGSYEVFATDPRMISSIGVELDSARDRVLVCNSDAGAGEKTSKETATRLAALAVFQLSSGKLIKYIDLAKGLEGGHFCNDIALDKDGTAYITDSFSPIIYKVDPDYNASVLFSDPAFSGKSFNLNGIVVKDNYLLVVKMNSGQLFKIPLDNPKSFTEVEVMTSEKFEGADGLLWAPDGSLILIAGNNAHIGVPANTDTNAVFRLTSNDDWKTATVKGKSDTGDVFASTGTIRDGEIYVMHSMLHVLFNPETKQHIEQFDIKKYNP